MLSLSNVSGPQASGYFSADDYYTKADDAAPPSYWHGKGAVALNLSGEVRDEDLRPLLAGELPDGSHIRTGWLKQGKGPKRTGGTDLTFSAPKSVTITALVVGDKRVEEAHDRAVRRTLAYAETYAGTRESKSRPAERTGNLIIASITHTLSRNADPQLHTHNILINATLRSDGQWRSLSNRFAYQMKMQLGAMYRSELARELQLIGYGIRRTHDDGRFELAGYTPQQIAEFSTRSKDIDAALAAKGLSRLEPGPGQVKASAALIKKHGTLASRLAKKDVDRGHLLDAWQMKARSLGIDVEPPAQHTIRDRADPQWQNAPRHPLGDASKAVTAVRYAIEHLTEREAVVPLQSVRLLALQHSVGSATLADIDAEVFRLVESAELFRRGDELTTSVALFRERDTLRISDIGKGAFPAAIASAPVVDRHLARLSLTVGQAAAVRLVLTTQDRVSAVSGRAGTGKTTMLREVRHLANKSGVEVIGLAPSNRAAAELRAAGIPGQTLHKFLFDKERVIGPNTLLILDEASMVDARLMRRLLSRAEKDNARVFLLGDERQLSAVEAGRPFDQLIHSGMAHSTMDEIQRQLGERYRASVAAAAEGRMADVLRMVRANLREVSADVERYHMIAKEYAELSPEERRATLVVSGENKARQAINIAIRDELGMGTGQAVAVLERIDMTRAQAKRAILYTPGTVIEAEREYARSLSIARGDRLTVVSVDVLANRVTLQHSDGRTVLWSPHRHTHFTAYAPRALPLARGDRVQFLKGDNLHHVTRRDVAEVLSVDRDYLELRHEGKRISLPLNTAHHLDHSYCVTTHVSQGSTVRRVILDADTRSRTMTDAAFYVALSRGRHALRIYTDDLSKLPAAISRPSKKRAAMELSEPAYVSSRPAHQRVA